MEAQMKFFNRLFGKEPAVPFPNPIDEDEDIQLTGAQPIQGPPEFVRAVELQQAYWTNNVEEQSQLEARGVERLSWRERLRLHHLTCLQRIYSRSERAPATEKCRQSVRRLIAFDSPYRPRPAMIWQGQATQQGSSQEPDMLGKFLNASLTHLGCLEIIRVDAANQPAGIDFVSFDEFSGVIFAPPNLIRAAKLFYDDGRDEMVFVPMLYGVTWSIGNEHDRAGRMTRFVAHMYDEEASELGTSGLGVGQQDFAVFNQDGSRSLFGIGSVAEISFPLDISDPRFDEKARARGIDPDEVRRKSSRRR
jgi:hypothetical protein